MDKESAFFALVHPDDVDVVRETIEDPEPLEIIVENLRLLLSEDAVKAFRRWKTPITSADIFLLEMPASRETLALKFLSNSSHENFSSLDTLLGTCSAEARLAYEQWKALPPSERLPSSTAWNSTSVETGSSSHTSTENLHDVMHCSGDSGPPNPIEDGSESLVFAPPSGDRYYEDDTIEATDDMARTPSEPDLGTLDVDAIEPTAGQNEVPELINQSIDNSDESPAAETPDPASLSSNDLRNFTNGSLSGPVSDSQHVPSIDAISSPLQATPDTTNLAQNMHQEPHVQSDPVPQPSPRGIPQNLPNQTNILFLGETGVGKSTFINGMVNYLVHDSMDDALRNGVQVLIDSKFSLTDDNFVAREVFANRPRCANAVAQNEPQNENMIDGQSSTQDPKAHTFQYGTAANPCFITIIDTPGIGDVRGTQQDGENMAKILSFIAQYDKIHAICILLKPNEARMTITFRFCVDELLRHLHKSASQNILFCFTNSRTTFYRPGNSLPTLAEHLRKLSTTRQIDIHLNKSTMFCFDNEAFRFLCAYKQDSNEFTAGQKESFEGSWKQSVEETNRLFARIAELPPHDTREMLSINTTRQAILRLARPLSEMNKNLLRNIQDFEAKRAEVMQLQLDGVDLRGRLHISKTVLFLKEAKYPQTVCTAASCVEHRRIGTDMTSVVETVYKTVCHEDCQLDGVSEGGVQNASLKHCVALRENVEKCKKCGCPWQLHMHIRYRIREKSIKAIDEDVNKKFKKVKGETLNGNRFLKNLKRMIDQMKGEQTRITKMCAEFAAYLNHNSILPYNDTYDEYSQFQIREESEKGPLTRDDGLIEQMTKHLEEYRTTVSVLKDNLERATTNRRTVDEINAMLTELQSIERYKDLLIDVAKVEIRATGDRRYHLGGITEIPGRIIRSVGRSCDTLGQIVNNAMSVTGSLGHFHY